MLALGPGALFTCRNKFPWRKGVFYFLSAPSPPALGVRWQQHAGSEGPPLQQSPADPFLGIAARQGVLLLSSLQGSDHWGRQRPPNIGVFGKAALAVHIVAVIRFGVVRGKGWVLRYLAINLIFGRQFAGGKAMPLHQTCSSSIPKYYDSEVDSSLKPTGQGVKSQE